MRTFIAVTALVGSLSIASAQVAELSASGGVSRFGGTELISNDPDFGTLTLGDGFRMGIRFTFNTGRFTGHEIGYAYSRTNLGIQGSEVGVNMHGAFYDFLVYATPEGTRLRPFVCGGAGFNSFFPPGASVSYGNQIMKFGLNYGGGVKAIVSGPWGVRFDIRQYASGKPDFLQTTNAPSGWMRQTEVSAGLSFNF